MKVQFEFTQEDMIDLDRRVNKRSKFFKKNYRKNLIIYSIIIFMFSFIIFSEESFITKIIYAMFFSLIYIAIYPFLVRRRQRKNVRKFLKEFYNTTGPFVCEVELTPDGFYSKQMNIQIFQKWEDVNEIVETPDSLDIFTNNNNSGVIIRKRAFNSKEEQNKFFNLAKDYLKLSKERKQN
jgi:uncharacterized membrane protein SirB2